MKSPKNLNDGTPITMAKQLECPRKLGSMVGIRVNNIPILHSWDIYWGENKPLIRSPLIRRSSLPLLSSETRTEAIGRGTNFFGEENGRLIRSQQARRQFLRGWVMINRYMGVSQKWGNTTEMDGENTGKPY